MGKRLDRVRNAQFEYRRLTEKVEILETIATRATSRITGLPKTHSENHNDTWATLVDYKLECQGQLLIILQESRALERELDCIRSSKIRTAMKYRYIDCLKLEAIAERMSYDVRSITRFLETGKKIYEEIYGDETDERSPA